MIRITKYIFISAFICCSFTAQSQDIKKLFNRAYHFLTLDNVEAVASFTKVIELDSAYAEAYYFRGIAHFKLEKYYSSLYDFTKAISLDKDLQIVQIYKGFIYRKLNENDSAIHYFNKYILDNPQDTSAYNFVLRGRLKSNIGDIDGAISDFQHAIDLDPIKESYYYHKFMAHFDKKEFNEAILQIDKCIKINPDFYGYYFYRGNALFALEDFDQAVGEYSIAINLNVENADVYYHRGLAEQARNHTEEAIRDFDTAIAYNPRDGTYFFQRGHAKLSIGNKLGACDDWYVAGSLGYYEDFQKIKEVCE